MAQSLFSSNLIINQSNINLETMHYYSHKWGVEREQTQKGVFSTSFNVVHTPRIQLGHVKYSHGVLRKGDIPNGAIYLGFVIGKDSTIYQKQTVRSNEIIVIEDGEDMDLFSHAQSSMYIVSIEKDLFYNKFYNYFFLSFEEVKKQKRFFIEESEITTFTSGIAKWINYLQSSQFLALKEKSYIDIENNILSFIFDLFLLKDKKMQRSKFDIGQVRDVLDQSIQKKITIDAIVQHFHISERTLHNTFKNTYLIAPKKYLQNLRLNAIRNELLKRDVSTTNISDIAFRYGFTHMSHFAKEYKKMFSELPSKTLKKYKFAV